MNLSNRILYKGENAGGYQQGLELVTRLGQEQNTEELGRLLEIPKSALEFSLECVGNTTRMGALTIRGVKQKMTHFTHMARVAFLVKYYFPKDSFNRILAVFHDIKEEALPEKKNRYKDANREFNVEGLSEAIELLTEEKPMESEIRGVRNEIPKEFTAAYIAKYRKYIKRLHKEWPKIGNLELCDRLDGSTSFEYLNNIKPAKRRRQKALESFARIWATIETSDHPLVEEIKSSCRKWMPQFNVTEPEVERIAKLFLV